MTTHSILLIEDNPADAETVRRGLKRSGLNFEMEVLRDGKSARTHLSRTGFSPYDLVIFDLNLPGIDGRTLLKTSESGPGTEAPPVVVLTTSRNQDDIVHSYEAGVNAYVVKPGNVTDFLTKIEAFSTYYLKGPGAKVMECHPHE